jgi:anti-sigma B factor antagonist
MKIDVSIEGVVTVLSLQGDLVLGPAEQEFNRTVSRLLEEGNVNFLVDLAGVKRLDSSGLGALIRALANSQKEGGVTKLLHVSPFIDNLLKITQLHTIFEICDDRDRAIASF